MGSSTAYIMTISNSIIGVSVLAMPFCYKQCGILLSTLLLVLSNILSKSTCHFLLKSAIMSRRRNYELLAFHVFGTMGKTFVELSIIGFMMGTCIAFFVVMGDLGPAILSNIFTHIQIETLRPIVLMGIAVFIVLPLGLLRNVESLSAVSTATILFYLCLVLKMLAESSTHLFQGDWVSEVRYWNPDGLLQCLPIFSMALFCQTQLFDIFESTPNLSLDRMNKYIGSAVNMCTAVYMSVGFFGYVAYYKLTNLSGNVLLSFSPNASSEIIKFGFVLSIAVSFPLVIFPCRASIYSFLFRKGHSPHYESVTHGSMVAGSSHIPESRFRCITLFIIFVSLFTALMATNIELVLGLVGATIGVLICVLLPSYVFVTLNGKQTTERLVAKIIFLVGLCIMFLGTYANLMASENVERVTPLPSMFIKQQDSNKGEIMHLAESMRLSNNLIMQGVDSKIEKPNLQTKPPEVNKIRHDYNQKLIEEKQKRERALEKVSRKVENELEVNKIDKNNKRIDANIENKILNTIMVNDEKKVVANDVKNTDSSNKKDKVGATSNIEGARKEDLINNEAIRKDENETQNEISVNVPPKVAQNHEIEILEKLKKQEEEQKKIMKQQEVILKEVIKQNQQLEEIKAKDETLKENKKSEGILFQSIPNVDTRNKLESNRGSGLVSHLNPAKAVSSNLISEKIQELSDNIKELNRDEIKLTNQIDKAEKKIKQEQIVNKVPDGVQNQKGDGARDSINNVVKIAETFSKPVLGQIKVNKLTNHVSENDAGQTFDKKAGDANGELNNIESPPNEVSKVPLANSNANIENEAFIEVEKDLTYKKKKQNNSMNGLKSTEEKKSGAANLANAVPIALMLQPSKKPEPKPLDIIKTRDILEDVRREKRDVRQEPANPVPPEYEVVKQPIEQLNNVAESVKLPVENVIQSVDKLLEKMSKPIEIEDVVALRRRSLDKTLDKIREPTEMGEIVEKQFEGEASETAQTPKRIEENIDKLLKIAEEALNEPLEKSPLNMSKQSQDKVLSKNENSDKTFPHSETNHLLESNDKIMVTSSSNNSVDNNEATSILSNRTIPSAEIPSNLQSIINSADGIVNESNDLNIANSKTRMNADPTAPKNKINDSIVAKNVSEVSIKDSFNVQIEDKNESSNKMSNANIVNHLNVNNRSSDTKTEDINQNKKCDAKSSEDIRVPQILSNLEHDDILNSLQLDKRFNDHVINNIAADKT